MVGIGLGIYFGIKEERKRTQEELEKLHQDIDTIKQLLLQESLYPYEEEIDEYTAPTNDVVESKPPELPPRDYEVEEAEPPLTKEQEELKKRRLSGMLRQQKGNLKNTEIQAKKPKGNTLFRQLSNRIKSLNPESEGETS